MWRSERILAQGYVQPNEISGPRLHYFSGTDCS